MTTDDYRPDGKKIDEFERESKRAAAREEYKKAIEEAKLRDQRQRYEVQLELPEKIQETGIVDKFVYRADYDTVEVILNHVYDNVKVNCDINKKKWIKSIETFEHRLKEKGISKQHIAMLSNVLDHNHQVILDLDLYIVGKAKQRQQQQGHETNNNTNQGQEEQPDQNKESELVTLTIPQAARCTVDGQYIQTQGIVTTVFKLRKLAKKSVFRCLSCGALNESITYKLGNGKPHLFDGPRAPRSCLNCEEPYFELSSEYLNAVVIELRHLDTFSDIDPLYAVLFDDDTNAIHSRIAEVATIRGHIYILEQPTNHKSINYLYADSIEYESNQREVILTPKDEEAVFRFTKLNGHQNMLDVLANMFATDVIGELHAKKSIVLSAVSTGLDRTKKKINVGLVGSPGLAKSLLLRHAVKLVPGSRLESAQSSTGKGLTAAVTSKEGEGMILTTGAIPAAKGGIAALNEVGRISPDDQKYLMSWRSRNLP